MTAVEKVQLQRFASGPHAWCSTGEVRPTAQPKPSKPRYRTVPDPLEAVTDTLKAWFDADPDVTGRQLLDRLQVAHPGGYPDSLVRTVQRRLKAWRRERAKALVLGPPSIADASSPQLRPPPEVAPADAAA